MQHCNTKQSKNTMARYFFPTPKYLMVIFIITRLIPTLSNSSSPSWTNLTVDLTGKLSTAASAVQIAATDFGQTTKISPAAVLSPTTTADIVNLVRCSYDSPVPFPVAARGHGHSVHGQASARGGVVVDMRSLAVSGRNHQNEGVLMILDDMAYADVSGGALWIEVLEATWRIGYSPVSWTDYLYLSVGGTLSNGGISGQSSQQGPQISNVLEMDVITGKGELVTCSKDNNSDLFHAVLGGLGQFGIITRARIPLKPAPKRVKWLRFLYVDFSEFTEDQERLISETNAVDYLEGTLLLNHGSPNNWRSAFFPPSDHPKIISLVKKHKIVYCLEIVKHYDDTTRHTIDTEIQKVLKGLRHVEGFRYQRDVSYVEFLNRVRNGELKLKSQGEWEVPHPWLNLFIPKSQIFKFDNGVFKDIVLRNNITTGPVLVYPMLRKKWGDSMSVVIPEEDVFYTVGFLQSCGFEELEAHKNQIKEILKFCDDSGIQIKQYIPHYTNEEDWINHFGSKWDKFRDRKSRYDPKMILSPGQRIFT